MNKKKLLALLMALVMTLSLVPVTALAEYVPTNTSGDFYVDSTDSNLYHITTLAGLEEFRDSVNSGYAYEDMTVRLEADITMGSDSWTPIGNGTANGNTYTGTAFKGTFDGGNHTVSGLYIENSLDNAAGLFGVVDGGTVRNIVFESASVSCTGNGKKSTGAAVGLLVGNGTVSDVTVKSGSISGQKSTGGVVGMMTVEGTVVNCKNLGATVTGLTNVGGVIGSAYYGTAGSVAMQITNCENRGTVTSSDSYTGGIVGLCAANVSGCTNTGAVSSVKGAVAGIVGHQTACGSITNCRNTGAISNSSTGDFGVGGILGWARYMGNTTDYPYQNTIFVSNNTNAGTISGGASAGGIVGHVYHYATVTGNTNTAASISSSNFAAGIVGSYQISEKTCYFEGGERHITVSDNISTTPDGSITGICTHLFVYDNTSSANATISNNTTELVTDTNVAQIGDEKYETLAAAVAAVPLDNTPTTIELLCDSEGDGINFENGQNVIVDFKGHTYTVTGQTVGSTGTVTQGIRMLAGSTVTLKNGTAKAGANTANLVQLVHSYSTVNLIDFTVDARENALTSIAYEADCGTLNISGASNIYAYEGKTGLYTAFWHYGSYDGTTVNVDTTGTITGELVYEFDERTPGGVAATENKGYLNISNGNFEISAIDVLFSGDIAENLKVANISIDGGTFTADPTPYLADGYMVKSVTGGYQVVPDSEAVAQIGNTKYATLAEAIAAAQNGDTITLLKDVSLNERLFVNAGASPVLSSDGRYATTSEDKSITLNLNGKNITSSSNIALAGGSLNITGSGTIKSTGSGLAPVEIRGTGDLATKRTLTIGQNVTLEGGEYGLNVFGSNDQNGDANSIEVNINGTIQGCVFVLGNLINESNDITVNVNSGARVTTEDGGYNQAIANNGYATVNINSGATVIGKSTGIETRAGTLNIFEGATVTGLGSGATASTPNGSGCTTTNAGVAVAQHTTKKPTTLNISGGTITGTTALYISNPQENTEMNMTVNVTGGQFNGGVASTSYDTSGKAVENSDTRIKNFISGGVFSTQPDANYVASGYKAVDNGDGNWTVSADYVAQIGDNKFTSIQAAINSVSAGGSAEVELLADVATSGTAYGYIVVHNNKNITLDLNGHIFSNTAGSNKYYAAAIFDGTLTVKDSGEGGKIKAVANTEGGSVVFITEGGTFTLESGTIDATGGYMAVMTSNDDTVETVNVEDGAIVGDTYCVALWKKDALNVSGGSITANGEDSFAVCNNGSIGAANPTTMNISGGTITGGYGIYHAGPGTLNITGGSIVGRTKSGVEMRAGSMNMTGGSVESQSTTDPAAEPNGNGSTTDGAAIAVSQHTTKLPVFVGVSGGTVTGNAAVFVTNPEGNAATDGNVSLYLSGGTFDGNILVTDTRVVSFIDGGLYTVNLTESEYSQYIISPKTGVEADTQGYYTVAFETHTHNYGEPTWSWKISGTTWSATAYFACSECDHVEPVTATVTSNESITETSTTTTYSAVATFNGIDYPNSKTVTVENTYTVTIGDGSIEVSGGGDSFRYGETATLTADGKADWTIDGVTVASGTNTYRFVVTKNVTVTATASVQENTQPVLYATLKQSGQGKTVLQAGWNLPEGYSIISATTYRGTSRSSSPVAEATILAKGAQTKLNLTAREATYTGTYTVSPSSYGKYQNVELIVVYRDGKGVEHTWSSGVLNVQIPS